MLLHFFYLPLPFRCPTIFFPLRFFLSSHLHSPPALFLFNSLPLLFCPLLSPSLFSSYFLPPILQTSSFFPFFFSFAFTPFSSLALPILSFAKTLLHSTLQAFLHLFSSNYIVCLLSSFLSFLFSPPLSSLKHFPSPPQSFLISLSFISLYPLLSLGLISCCHSSSMLMRESIFGL